MILRSLRLLALLSLISAQALQGQPVWSLEQCLDYALQNNLELRTSHIGVEQAGLNVQQNRLNRLPNLNASAGYGLAFGRFTNPDNLTIDATQSQSNNYNMTSSVPLFQGFGISRSIRMAQDQFSLAEMDRRAAEDMIRLRVLSAYLGVLLAIEDQNRFNYQYQVSQDNLENSRKLANAGAIPEGNLRELEAQLAADDLGQIQAQNTLTIAYIVLRNVMQADPDVQFVVKVPVQDDMDRWLVVEDWNAQDILALAAAQLPSMKRNLLAEQVALDNIRVVRSGLYPSIGMSGSASTSWFTEKAIADFLPPYAEQLDNNFGQSIGVGINIPIFNNGIVRNNIRVAELNADQQKVNTELELNALRQTIEQAVADARAAASSYQAALRVVEARRLALDFAQKRFDAGQAPSFELNNARNLLLASEADLLSAKYNFLLASKTLDFYQGRQIGM